MDSFTKQQLKNPIDKIKLQPLLISQGSDTAQQIDLVLTSSDQLANFNRNQLLQQGEPDPFKKIEENDSEDFEGDRLQNDRAVLGIYKDKLTKSEEEEDPQVEQLRQNIFKENKVDAITDHIME